MARRRACARRINRCSAPGSKTASPWPDSEDFTAPRRIFRLRAHDEQTLQFQHASYRTYFDKAKPGARLLPDRHGLPVPAVCAGAAVGDAESCSTPCTRRRLRTRSWGETLACWAVYCAVPTGGGGSRRLCSGPASSWRRGAAAGAGWGLGFD